MPVPPKLTLCQPRLASIAACFVLLGGIRGDSASYFAADSTIVHRDALRTPAVDQVREWLGVSAWRAQGGSAGENVVLAVIDTGFSLRHPTLRDRPYVYFDFAQHQPAPTRIESNQVQQWIEQEQRSGARASRIPEDLLGHGTLIASIAAGQNPADSSYDGIAPGVSLVLIRVGTQDAIDPAAWSQAIQLALSTAQGRPLVILTTATSISGTHDAQRLGTGSLILQGPQVALVVAGANHGDANAHQRVQLARGAAMKIGFRALLPEGQTTSFTLVHERPIEFHLTFPDGTRTRRFLSTDHRGATHNDWTVGVEGDPTPPSREQQQEALSINQQPHAVAITLQRGAVAVRPGDQWSLVVTGSGVVDVFSAPPSIEFVAGDNEMTLGDVATNAETLAITALATRDRWPAVGGDFIQPIASDYEGVARFSSRGPDRVHHVRPDLAAPGGWIVGALSLEANRALPGSPIAVENHRTQNPLYVAAAGTSVAAPVAAGAIARVWSSHPSYSRDMVVSRLTSASPQWSAGLGWGSIDLRNEFAAPNAPPEECSLVPARDHILPGQPDEFAMRTRSRGRSLREAITPVVLVSEGVVTQLTAMDGGRTRIRWRASSASATRLVTVTARVQNTPEDPPVQCQATVRIENEAPSSTEIASCSAGQRFAKQNRNPLRNLVICLGALTWVLSRRSPSGRQARGLS